MNAAPYSYCQLCRQYLEEAGSAIREHLRALSALESAVGENDSARFVALSDAVGAARIARENTITRYENHLYSHSDKRINSAAV